MNRSKLLVHHILMYQIRIYFIDWNYRLSIKLRKNVEIITLYGKYIIIYVDCRIYSKIWFLMEMGI